MEWIESVEGSGSLARVGTFTDFERFIFNFHNDNSFCIMCLNLIEKF
jgi:hypothetical protein